MTRTVTWDVTVWTDAPDDRAHIETVIAAFGAELDGVSDEGPWKATVLLGEVIPGDPHDSPKSAVNDLLARRPRPALRVDALQRALEERPGVQIGRVAVRADLT